MAKAKRKKKSPVRRKRRAGTRIRRRRKASAGRRRLRRVRGHRRLRRNPDSDPIVGAFPSATASVATVKSAAKRLTKKQRAAKARAMANRAKKMRMAVVGAAPSLAKSTRLAQARRLSTLAKAVRHRGAGAKRSPLAKAMEVKLNPGLAGLKSAAMVLAPQAAVGAVGLVGLAMAGKKVSEMVASKLPVSVQPYAPALATAGLSVVAYVVADKVAPKYKGAIAIGGMLAAVIQAIAASQSDLAVKAKSALVGEYTTVGSGIFRGVGNAHTFRARNYGDNQMEWADDSLRGLGTGADNATEFAPGEGGILSGGIFR